ncbi:tetraacyldisaccharide 4'-kinase [Rugamonas apoptosis]|uniref:Tetraacyldisaccharide 4'-kinase n=1 Tax=Rugamonas apoptosis TaxID=2758570 RepID=A0A7W2FED2_9BURK|nr:tetraacyldisaccharide 4'-kinase [Rugamonas apoptosis]MBA5690054.1 tetraacyldisaccharide 4'-kinase [Rugamonas apoptosis]
MNHATPARPAAQESTRGAAIEAALTRAWLRRGPLACALWPLSQLFRALGALRRLLFRAGWLASHRLPVPVVVVGNIFIGGTGKTPLTIWLVQALQQAGMRPGVISRGHGGDGADGAALRAVTSASTAQQVGDEPLLIAQRTGCPVVVGRDRAAAGRALLASHPDTDILLTDDGLQHYALQRDVEIILFDGRGAGNGWLLPAGPLREPRSRRRDVTVVNAPELTPALARAVGDPAPVQMRLVGEVAEQLCDRSRKVPLAALAQPGARLAAAAGIGNPSRFFGMLRAAGLDCAELPLPDHHDFRDRPFDGLAADVILMTEKDAVKCAQIDELKDDPRLWVVPVTARIDAALADLIVEKCRGRKTA